MLKKLKHKGVAMVEYAVLLAFVCSISSLYLSDTSLSASIDNTITKVVKLLAGEDFAGEDYITSYKNKLDDFFKGELSTANGKIGDDLWTLGKAIVSNKPNSVRYHLDKAGFSQDITVGIVNQPQKKYKSWLDTLSRNGDSVTDKVDKVVKITVNDPTDSNTSYEIQYAYSGDRGYTGSDLPKGSTTLLGSRVIKVQKTN